MNITLTEDFEYISEYNIDYEKFRNKTILITGATGFIGSLLVKALLYCNDKHRLNLKVIALARSEEKASKLYMKKEFYE